MQHELNPETLGPFGDALASEIGKCVHCGFCLSACPTYEVLGQEMDSPRGRIVLMKEVLEGKTDPAAVQPHIDACLGCLACEPACPSGVRYREILSPYRALTAKSKKQTVAERLRDRMISATLPYPARLRAALRIGRLAAPFKGLAPSALRPMLDMAPRIPARITLPERVPAEGEKRGRVALLTGCAQSVLAPEINAAAARLLAGQGIDVVIPKNQGCCGSLDWHNGHAGAARRHLRGLIRSLPEEVDAVITTAAGCGSGIAEAGLVLRGTADEEAGRRLAGSAVDISRYLHGIGLRDVTGPPEPLRVAIQDACHLVNGQGVYREIRELLSAVPGIEVVELASATCCGSAGTYNLEQPRLAAGLGRRKAEEIRDSGADTVVTGNIGCLVQLRRYLEPSGEPSGGPPIRHVVELLAELAG